MNKLTRDAENMLDIMERTANSRDNGWQYIYWIAVAVYHLLVNAQKERAKRLGNGR